MNPKAAVMAALAHMDERPERAARSLADFQRSEQAFSARHPRLVDAYPEQWVAVSDGVVVAHGEHLDEVVGEAERRGYNRSDIIVRFIERTQRTLIL